MRGIVYKTFERNAGFFFVQGEDGVVYYANRKSIVPTETIPKKLIRKDLTKFVIEGRHIQFDLLKNPNASKSLDRPYIANNITFED